MAPSSKPDLEASLTIYESGIRLMTKDQIICFGSISDESLIIPAYRVKAFVKRLDQHSLVSFSQDGTKWTMEAMEGPKAYPVVIKESFEFPEANELIVLIVYPMPSMKIASAKIPADRYFSLLDRIKPFMACDDFRPQLNGIYFGHETPWRGMSSFRAVATDGHALAVEDIEDMSSLFGPSNSSFIWRPDYRFMPRLKKAGDTVEMSVYKDGDQPWIEIRVGEWKIINKTIDGLYPPYIKVLSDRDFTASKFKVRTDILKVMKKVSATVVFDFMTEPRSGFMTITTKAENGVTAKTLIPISESGFHPGPVAFNSHWLLNIAAFMQVDEIEMQGNRSTSDMYCAEGSGRFAILMPMRMPDWVINGE